MATLTELFPQADVLIALEPEELAPIILRLASEDGRSLNIATVEGQADGSLHGGGYSPQKRPDVLLAIGEAWNWLRVQGLIIPQSGYNGTNGHMHLTRRGAALRDTASFKEFARAAAFPKSLLHPAIADEVWVDLARGDYETAIFRAFKRLEVAVRDACGFSTRDYGVDLMRKAFHPKTGPLTDTSVEPPEREAVSALFAGAVGRYRNPNVHRDLEISHGEAQEIVMLASHLLRIVDARRTARGA